MASPESPSLATGLAILLVKTKEKPEEGSDVVLLDVASGKSLFDITAPKWASYSAAWLATNVGLFFFFVCIFLFFPF